MAGSDLEDAGWQKFLDKGGKKIRKANGYHGSQLNDHGERRARALIEARIEVYDMSLEKLRAESKEDWKKALLAAMIQDETTMRLDWISEELRMGTRAGECRAAKSARDKMRSDRKIAA